MLRRPRTAASGVLSSCDNSLLRHFAAAGLVVEGTFGVEGPGWLLWERCDKESHREGILIAARTLEQEASVISVSGHLLTFARK